ncbi:hypothetical protein ABBQ32_011068 [Trebouxia sp. C0010 RCD-2024]
MTSTTETAVFTDSPYLSGSSLQAVMREHDFELGTLAIVTSSATLQANTVQHAFQKAVSLATVQGHHDPAFLGLMASTLKAGAGLTVYEPANSPSTEATAQLKKALLLAGFVDSTDRGLVQTAQGQHVCVTASKPQYAVGAKASITLKPKQQQKQMSWTLAADNDDDELLDEDELLTEEDRQRPAVLDDCEVGAGKKACKNCTCGRADAEAAVQKVDLSQDMIDNPQSACGSCGLGDAFRCSTCPYRGLPSFEMGKKIELGSDFLTADA